MITPLAALVPVQNGAPLRIVKSDWRGIVIEEKIEDIGFITRWTVSGDATARTITLPLVQNRTEGALSYDFEVIYGYGTANSVTKKVTAYNDANRSHTFAANGTYDVRITGVCEGWSFNNLGDKLKIVGVVNWGNGGFKYLRSGFYGCTNLTSLPTGSIPASGTGILTDGFSATFRNTRITSIPDGIFDRHPNVTTDAYYQTFMECTLLTEVTTEPFKYGTLASTRAFMQTFRFCIALTTINANLFRYNTLVTTYAFYDCFQDDAMLAAIPTDLFRYCVLASDYAFEGTFIGCDALTTIPADLFRYNVNVALQGFSETFRGCINLETTPDYLFRYNTKVNGLGTGGFYYTFADCPKLQINPLTFYAVGEESTRFIATTSHFKYCYQRATFSGNQGTAPDLWNCTFPTRLELSTRPATLWVAGDIITGQSSGATGEFVAWDGLWWILLKNVSGNYQSDESIGVTGVPNKIANQSAGYPIQASGLISTVDCFDGAGNSGTSISNYASIPAPWI